MIIFIIYIASVIALTALLSSALTKSQKEQILKTTYRETINADGTIKTIIKIKCPICGNKDIDFQMVASSISTLNTSRKTTFARINSRKHAVCKKCGHDFTVILNSRTFTNIIGSFFISIILCSVGLVVFSVVYAIIAF